MFKVQNLKVEGTPLVQRTSWSSGLSVSGDGVGVIAHTGSIALRMVAERTGLVDQLSKAMVRRSFVPLHDRGQVVTDVAVMLVDGGEAISDINVLRHQSKVLGPVASASTVWRTLDELTPARLGKIEIARARTRRHVWSQLEVAGGIPASKVADTDLGKTVVLDVDATIVVCHSEKEMAAPTFKKTFGYHPIGVWCDNTQEFLSSKLRTGRAGSNTAADHIEVLTDAIAQIPGWTVSKAPVGALRWGGHVPQVGELAGGARPRPGPHPGVQPRFRHHGEGPRRHHRRHSQRMDHGIDG